MSKPSCISLPSPTPPAVWDDHFSVPDWTVPHLTTKTQTNVYFFIFLKLFISTFHPPRCNVSPSSQKLSMSASCGYTVKAPTDLSTNQSKIHSILQNNNL